MVPIIKVIRRSRALKDILIKETTNNVSTNNLLLGSESEPLGLALASATVLIIPTPTIRAPGMAKATKKFHHTQKSWIKAIQKWVFFRKRQNVIKAVYRHRGLKG